MDLPIERRLADENQSRKARLQDYALEALYSIDPSAILHGGTAIWRCYGGNRFSDDIDLYIQSDEKITAIRNNLTFAIRKYDLQSGKSSVSGSYTIFKILGEGTELKVEMVRNRTRLRPVERNYERSNGTHMSVLTLTPEAFILEKIKTYESRRYIRDLYDIYHLSSIVTEKGAIGKRICAFINNIGKPVDERVLKSIVYSGAAPSFEGMVNELKRRFC